MFTKALQLNNEKTVFWGLVGIIVIAIGFYMYFINATVHNIVLRQNLESEAGTLTLAIGKQEFEYIKGRNSITLQMAYNMGFKDVSEKTYISRNSVSQVSYLPR